MYVYEKKNNKAKGLIAVSFVVLFLFACLLFLYRYKHEEVIRVGNEEESAVRLQLPSLSYEEAFVLPYSVNAAQLMNFFDPAKDTDALEKAVVEFEGVYRPSQGVDYGYDNKVFEVTPMLSGEVSEVREDSLMGKSVTVVSKDVEITYQSLSAVNVSEGDIVGQTTILGLAGENLYNQSLGIHLHVVAEKDGKLIDPASLIGLKLSELQ